MLVLSLFTTLVAVSTAFVANDDATPPIPELPQSFRCNFTMNVPLVNPTAMHLFHGYLELEYGEGAGTLHFEGEEFVPAYIMTNVKVAPNPTDGLRAYWFNDQTCWYTPAQPKLLHLWPLIIPPTAKYGGQVVCGSSMCQEWQWSENDAGQITMQVMNAAPHSVQSVVIDPGFFGLTAVFTVSNTVVGLPPKRDLLPPTQKCIARPIDEEEELARPVPALLTQALKRAGTPPIPKIAKQFSANYTLRGSYGTLLTNSKLITGAVWFDDVNGAGRIEFNSTDTPLQVETTWVANPHGEIITGYMFNSPLCWQHSVSKSFLKILPLEIPSTAKFEGHVTVRGAACTKWSFATSEYGSSFIYYVRTKDGALVRVQGDTNLSSGLATLDIYNYKIGPISPSTHQAPKGYCWQVPII